MGRHNKNKNSNKQKQIQERKQQRKQEREQRKKHKKQRQKLDAFKLDRQYIEYFDRFQQEIRPLHLKLRDVGGDGSCLFRSIGDQVDGDESTHRFMREEACRYILENEQFFTPFIDEDEDGTLEQYVHEMRKDGEWGGHLELQALSECFRCIIVIHKRQLEEVYITPLTQRPEGGIIHLAYFQHEDFQHYLSIRDLEDNSNLPAINQLKAINANLYSHLLVEDQEEYFFMKQMEQLGIQNQHMEQYEEEEEQVPEVQEEPYPNYPRNKKCKCGSKQPYKNCCYKEYQKRIAKKQAY